MLNFNFKAPFSFLKIMPFNYWWFYFVYIHRSVFLSFFPQSLALDFSFRTTLARSPRDCSYLETLFEEPAEKTADINFTSLNQHPLCKLMVFINSLARVIRFSTKKYLLLVPGRYGPCDRRLGQRWLSWLVFYRHMAQQNWLFRIRMQVR